MEFKGVRFTVLLFKALHWLSHIMVRQETTFATLFSSREPDDPILFSVDEDPVNVLDEDIEIDVANLEATEWDKIWNCTIYQQYVGAVKAFEVETPV
ncbi:hypothetical protein BJX65DRAFT_312874 [Aspergillus insuetus]